MPKSILFVHQGYELYGSDRTLIQSVQAAIERWPEARITVLIPADGPLRRALMDIVEDVQIADLAVLRKSNIKRARLGDVFGVARKILSARRMMASYGVTYINTVTVMNFIFASCFTCRPRMVHVHEIPTGPAAFFFRSLLVFSRAFLVFNSEATRRSFYVPPWQHFAIVWNGVAAPRETAPELSHRKLNLLLIGRFNSWKGQAILVRSIAKLPAAKRDSVNVRLVGSVFGDQDHFVDDLKVLINEHGLSNSVTMYPFTPDPSPHYFWADAVVVPSTKPEPFGLVAIEAMAAGRAVIAANHGGLSEIVVDGVTGSLIAPGPVEALSAAIEAYLEDPGMAARLGREGRRRFEAEFEESRYKRKITDVLAKLCAE
jgi:glycosyltransferase involved in cell wall biosynthesis